MASPRTMPGVRWSEEKPTEPCPAGLVWRRMSWGGRVGGRPRRTWGNTGQLEVAGEGHSPRAGKEASWHQGGAASGARRGLSAARSSSHRADEENTETS